jgi:flagellar basal body-associated protein FliL
MTVALTVSVVAAYYSIIGLTAIFAAAVIPVIIMGAVLELAKVTTAIWLHSFWHEAPALIKWYLTSATIILMLITSMGIFGFLSKAHIEQNANSGGIVAQIERVDQEIERRNLTIQRANTTITQVAENVRTADTDIQARITTQERLISDITTRLETDISTQNQLVSQLGNTDLQTELTRISTQRRELSVARQGDDTMLVQRIVGAQPDGVFGPGTAQAIATYTTGLDSRQAEIVAAIAQQADDPQVAIARTEITRLQQSANAEINRAQQAINAFRTQLITVTTADNSDSIDEQQLIIDDATNQVSELLISKFELQGELRILEVEVGPVKYIAELVYGESNPDVLEQAVRWVIIILVVVFDPLALVLVIAGLSIIGQRPTPLDTLPELPHTDPTPDIVDVPEKTDTKSVPQSHKPASSGINITGS